MNPWKSERWQRNIPADALGRGNRVFVFADHGVNAEVKRACREVVEWLKGQYVFPLPLRVYLRDREMLRTMDGGLAYGTFFEPVNFAASSYVRVAVGGYAALAPPSGRTAPWPRSCASPTN